MDKIGLSIKESGSIEIIKELKAGIAEDLVSAS